MTQTLKRGLSAAVLACMLMLAFAMPASAASVAPPCWKTLLTDWYDGTINNTYPIPCYQQAVNHLPTDAQLYSNAKDDILRAMARAIAAENQATTTATTTTDSTTTDSTTTTAVVVVVPPQTTASPGRPKPKGIARALDKLNPGKADSFPLPLLVLGALAILLVAAGIVGMIWRRMDSDRTDTGTS